MVDTNPTFNQTFRFVASGTTGNLVVSRQDILALLQVSYASTTGYRLINSAVINWLDIYLPPPATTTPAYQIFSMTWLGAYAKAKVLQLTSLGTAAISHLRTRPPKNSVASFWSISGTDESEPLFSMDVTANVVIDVNLSYTLQNFVDYNAAAVSSTSSKTLTTGVLYGAALDGVASNVMTPLGRLQF
jgi:hypothetical protein